MLLAIVPVILPVLAGVALVGGGVLLWWYASDGDQKLEPGNKPGQLGPGDTPGPGAPKELIEQYAGTFEDGKFHQTQSGNSIAGTAYQVVKKIAPEQANSPGVVGAVRRILNMSEFNRAYFGEPRPEDNYAVEGVAINGAFMPKHEDTVGVMSLGFLPIRNIDAEGTRVGPSTEWGDPWVPALNHDAVKAGATDPALLLAGTWEDGTPATEPPPEVFAVLEERA